MAKKEASIIAIIQQMIEEGETEEQIIQTLKDLGVEEEKAKKLLLLGQADTFALLRSEIGKIVKEDVEKEKPELKKYLEEEITKARNEMKTNIEKAVMTDIKQYEKDITGQSKTFQEQISETVHKVSELNNRVRNELNTVGKRIVKVEQDLDEFKVRGVGARNKYLGMAMVLLGLLFCASALYLFFIEFQNTISIDSVIITVIMAFIGITMMFVSTLL